MDPRQLAGMDHESLYRMREYARDPEIQKLLAAFEHRAFAREATRENPLMAASLLFATPLYTAGKAVGLINSRTPASWNQLGQGLLGIKEGLFNR